MSTQTMTGRNWGVGWDGKTVFNRLRVAIPTVGPMRRPPYEKGMSNRQRFEAFHAANPEVYDALKVLVLNDHAAGVRRINIATYWELLRYSSLKTSDANGEYAYNNTYRAFYARMLIAEHPEVRDMFELRKQRSE